MNIHIGTVFLHQDRRADHAVRGLFHHQRHVVGRRGLVGRRPVIILAGKSQLLRDAKVWMWLLHPSNKLICANNHSRYLVGVDVVGPGGGEAGPGPDGVPPLQPRPRRLLPATGRQPQAEPVVAAPTTQPASANIGICHL